MAVFDWVSEGRVDINGVTFYLPETANSPRDPAVPGLLLFKTPVLIQLIADIVSDLAPKRIFELGIHRGGSVVLFLLLAHPERHVAIDLAPGAPALEEWLREHDTDRTVRTYYGIDQADHEALHEIIDRDFGDEPLDLVIDDASHRYELTRTSFNVLFPRLRDGGLYVIEDWSWVHVLESVARARPDHAARIEAEREELAAPSPARLLIEQLLSVAGPLGVVDQLTVNRDLAVVRRGNASLDPETFDIGDCFGAIGRSLCMAREPGTTG